MLILEQRFANSVSFQRLNIKFSKLPIIKYQINYTSGFESMYEYSIKLTITVFIFAVDNKICTFDFSEIFCGCFN